MEVLAIMAVLGWLAVILGAIWMLLEAFNTGILWGLAYILIPFAAFVWILTHLDRAWRPLLWVVGGSVAIAFSGMCGV